MDIPVLPSYLFDPSLAGLASLLVTFGLPLLAAVLMKASWSSQVKGVVLLGLAMAKAFTEAFLVASGSGVDFDVMSTVYTVLINFGIAVAMYFGLYRGSDTVARLQASGPIRDSADPPPE